MVQKEPEIKEERVERFDGDRQACVIRDKEGRIIYDGLEEYPLEETERK